MASHQCMSHPVNEPPAEQGGLSIVSEEPGSRRKKVEILIMTRSICLLILFVSLAGCGIFSPSDLPLSAGEKESGYTYVPIDPFPVIRQTGEGCETNQKPSRAKLLDSFPDYAVRMLVERFEVDGVITYGSSKVGGRGQSHRITVDYILQIPSTSEYEYGRVF